MQPSNSRTGLADPKRRVTLAALAAGLFLTPCGVVAATRLGLRELTPRPPAPDLRLFTLGGRLLDLDEQAGQVTVVNFWSVRCRPCRTEMPSLQRLQEQMAQDGVQVWGVALGDDRQAVARYASRSEVAFPLLPDPEGNVSDQWSVAGLPTTDVVDKAGRIAFRVIGDADWSAAPMLARLRGLTRESAS